jgi:hypothetical protein
MSSGNHPKNHIYDICNLQHSLSLSKLWISFYHTKHLAPELSTLHHEACVVSSLFAMKIVVESSMEVYSWNIYILLEVFQVCIVISHTPYQCYMSLVAKLLSLDLLSLVDRLKLVHAIYTNMIIDRIK